MCGYPVQAGPCEYPAWWPTRDHTARCYWHAKLEAPSRYLAVRERPRGVWDRWHEPALPSADRTDPLDVEFKRFLAWISQRPGERRAIVADPASHVTREIWPNAETRSITPRALDLRAERAAKRRELESIGETT